MNSPELTQTGSMNSATNSVPEIVGGGLAAAAADRADGGGQYCQVPRHVRRQGRGGAARGHAATAGRRSLLRSRRASAWLSGKRDQTTFGPASAANSWPCARRSRGACAVWAMSHTRASRNLDFGFEVRGERQARVPPALLRVCACVRVCGLMLSSVFLQSFYYIYYLQKWGLHNRSQIPSDSENRRQIGGYIIAPKSHLTAKTE